MNVRNVIIPPSNEPDQSQIRFVANIVLMVFGYSCFILAMIAGVKLIFVYIFPNPDQQIPFNFDLFSAQVISPALLFLLGWFSSFFSVQLLRNRLFPIILQFTGFIVSGGMAAIYGWGVYKCSQELLLGPWKYGFVLAAGYLVLVSFFLLTDRFDFRIMVTPLIAIMVLHIFILVFHYVFFTPNNIDFFKYDLQLIIIMVILLGVMLNPRLYVPMRQAVNAVVDIISGALPPFLRNNTNPGPG